jgi:hypothetical protein
MSHGFLQRWRASTHRAELAAPVAAPRGIFRFADIERGWLVEDGDRAPIGRVHRSGQAATVVARGLLSSRLYVPPSAVAEVHEGVVRLNVTASWIAAQGWDREHGRRGH